MTRHGRRRVVVGLLSAGFTLGVAAGASLDALLGATAARAAVALFPGLLGTALWLAAGASVVATLSWTTLLTMVMATAVFILADPWSLLLEAVGITFLLAMVFIPRAGEEWTGAIGQLLGRR